MKDQLDRVKAVLREIDVEKMIREAVPDHHDTIKPLVTVVYAHNQHAVIAVYLDATRKAAPEDEKAYQWHAGEWIQHRMANFPLQQAYVSSLSDSELHRVVHHSVRTACLAMRAIGLGIEEPALPYEKDQIPSSTDRGVPSAKKRGEG